MVLEVCVERTAIRGSGDDGAEEMEPVTPAGRMFAQKKTSCYIICIVKLEQPFELAHLKKCVSETMARHKRFSSVLTRDEQGRYHWVSATVNIDEHVLLPDLSKEQRSSASFAEDYAAELALAPEMDPARPLWELHLLNCDQSQFTGSACVLRIHHSLGDGTSIMSLFLACTRKVSNPEELPTIQKLPAKQQDATFWRLLWVLWYSVIEIARFVLVSFFFPDDPSPIRGSAGVENSPKQIVSVHLPLDDMKAVKKAANATINDVLIGMISAGISRYLQHREPGKNPESYKIHASALVNTRKSPGLQEMADMMKSSSRARWGNQMGYIMIRLPLKNCKNHLEYVYQAKAVSDRKKLSLEAPFTYKTGHLLMKIAGAKAASDLTYRTLLNSTLAISNVMGPQEQVSFYGNPITSITPTVVGQPQALCLHLQSYMGRATLVATVAKDVIPDARTLLQYCKDALQEMKNAAAATASATSDAQ